MPYVINSKCIDTRDQSCVEECPVDCIYVGDRKLYINPNECIDCGACEPACPVDAITVDKQVPSNDQTFIDDSRRFFAELLPGREEPIGNPGGALQFGDVGVDTPLVADYRSATSPQ
ncbi:ferredoxin [Rhodococcus sp. WAY2]|uniref:ferredoxin n=1 Tax=Rhodococcus sp. WAY2 TaxID=2663121 RepID=UPI001357796A|nr:ferredoxin [Rhodococcus sp. WAY2]